MKRPPMFIKLRFGKKDGKFKLWLPLFILFPLIIVVLLLLAPLLLLAALVLWGFGWGKIFLLLIPVLLGLFWALRGLEVDIKDEREKVFISIT